MALWNNPLLRKTLVFMLAGLVSLAAIIAASLWLTSTMEQSAAEVIQERQVRTQAATLLSLISDAETGQRGFLLTEEANYLVPYEQALPRLPEAMSRLQTLAERTPRIRAAVDGVAQHFEAKTDELQRTIELARGGQRREALELLRSDRGQIAMQGIRAGIASIVTESERRIAGLLEDARRGTLALFWVNTASSALIALLTIAAGWTVARYTGELVEARQAVAAANLSLEARVLERTTDLARANDEIQRFAYIVSHDLRAPLVNIVGFTSELEASATALQRFVSQARVPAEEASLAAEAKTAANDDLPEAIGFIRASTTKMDRLINAILKLSREGRRELRPEPIDPTVLLEAISASLQHQVEAGGARIEIARNMPTLVSDRLALEQVFGNLIDNALKYLAPDRTGEINISASSGRGFVTVEIADNGRGIAPSDHERIFELFRRAGSQNVPGEGIGLAHVRALVRRLGGDITVQSELGRGSRFRVTLPRVYVRPSDQEKA